MNSRWCSARLSNGFRRSALHRAFLAGAAALCVFTGGAARALTFTSLPAGGAPFNHAPAIVALGKGALLACWYSGSGERNRDTVVRCTRSDDHGAHWAAPEIVVKAQETPRFATAPDKAVGNAVLARDAAGRTFLFYGVVQSRKLAGIETCRNWACGAVNFKISGDDGRTWSSGVRLAAQMGVLPRGGVLRAKAGDLLPLYVEGGRSGVLGLSLADMDAWSAPRAAATAIPSRNGVIQPSLTMGADGAVLAYLRDQKKKGVFVSRFDGAAFSPATLTNLANPGAAVEAFSDPGLGIMLVYNPSATGRDALALARTRDGARFDAGCTLTGGARLGEVSYPSVGRVDNDHWALVFSAHDKKTIEFVMLDRGFATRCFATPPPAP